jgi:hypothetical protein
MRKISLLLLSIGALLALSFYWQGPVIAQDRQTETPAPPADLPGDNPEDWGNWLFAQKVAGTSLSYGTVDEVGGQPIEPVWWTNTVTLHADGTGLLSSNGTFNGIPEFPGLSNPVYAAWERIGWRTIRVKHLVFNFAPDPTAGTLASIARNTVLLEFNRDFTQYEGTWVSEYFAPEQLLGPELHGPATPNTTEAPAYGTAGGDFWGTVLKVTPAP